MVPKTEFAVHPIYFAIDFHASSHAHVTAIRPLASTTHRPANAKPSRHHDACRHLHANHHFLRHRHHDRLYDPADPFPQNTSTTAANRSLSVARLRPDPARGITRLR